MLKRYFRVGNALTIIITSLATASVIHAAAITAAWTSGNNSNWDAGVDPAN